MDSEDDELLLLACAAVLLSKKKKRAVRRWSVRPLNRKRHKEGEFNRILRPMRDVDTERHFQYFRMDRGTFDNLLQRILPYLELRDCHGTPQPLIIGPAQRLAIGLRLLATGDSQRTVATSFLLGRSTVNGIFKEVLRAIWLALHEEFLAPPSPNDWKQIAADYWQKWNFPNCIGAIDGKHVVMKAPKNQGSLCINYKGTHSIVLLACVDANYLFRVVDIGAYGRQSDGGIFKESVFGQQLERGEMGLPQPAPLPGTQQKCPFVLVGDAAFPLKSYMMKPFSRARLDDREQAIFNYRLSRARRVVENAFGILAARWRIFLRRIELEMDNVEAVVKTAVVLHNFILRTCPCSRMYADLNSVVRDPSGLADISHASSNNYGGSPSDIRQLLKEFFLSDNGRVEWQDDAVDFVN